MRELWKAAAQVAKIPRDLTRMECARLIEKAVAIETIIGEFQGKPPEFIEKTLSSAYSEHVARDLITAMSVIAAVDAYFEARRQGTDPEAAYTRVYHGKTTELVQRYLARDRGNGNHRKKAA